MTPSPLNPKQKNKGPFARACARVTAAIMSDAKIIWQRLKDGDLPPPPLAR